MQTIEDRFVLLCDIDGVLAETPHEEAWFSAAKKWGITDNPAAFTEFYANRVAGQPGDEGARVILSALRSADGTTYTERKKLTAEALAQAAKEFRNPVKQRFLDEYIAQGRFRVFPDVGNILLQAKEEGTTVVAVSSSENAATILNLMDRADILPGLTGTVYDLFDAHALGAKTHWHDQKVEKVLHYCYARGIAYEAYRRSGKEGIPIPIVLEDAQEGIAAIHKYDFCCVGIARRAPSGRVLSTPEALREAGAMLAYDERDLARMSYRNLREALTEAIPAHTEGMMGVQQRRVR